MLSKTGMFVVAVNRFVRRGIPAPGCWSGTPFIVENKRSTEAEVTGNDRTQEARIHGLGPLAFGMVWLTPPFCYFIQFGWELIIIRTIDIALEWDQ